MDILERIEYFQKHYTVLENKSLSNGKKEYLGNKEQKCRFCGKSKPEVTFKTIAHAVPEFLGNKNLIRLNECDSCNEFFSNNLELHLDKFTKPFRTSALIKGKKKIPSNKSKDKKTRFDFKPGCIPQIIASRDNGLATIDHDNKAITYKFELEPYIPAAVYKCLVKIGLSVIDDKEILNFKTALHWIRDVFHFKRIFEPLVVIRRFIPGPRPNRELYITVLKKKDLVSFKPSYILIIGFGNIFYQIVLPSDQDTLLTEYKGNLVAFPLPFELNWEFGKVQTQLIDLTQPFLVRDDIVPITFSVENIVELPELTGKSFDELGIKI